MIRHKLYGEGQIVGRTVLEGRTYLTAAFPDGRQLRLAVPESFETGAVEALGPLKEEVERAVAEKKARYAAMSSGRVSGWRGIRGEAVDPVQYAFQRYLVGRGLSVESRRGNPTTVYAYTNAVDHVRAEEGLTWDGLKKGIGGILVKYDQGGARSELGARSKNTVINALRRFAEFAGGAA